MHGTISRSHRRKAATHRPVRAFALTAALAVTLSACGGSGGADESTGASAVDGTPETTELLVGITPVVDCASIFVAIDRGYFEEEGLDVTAQPAQGGASSTAAMISGEMQSAFSPYTAFMLAQQGGVDITIVAEGVRGTEETAGVYVAEDSEIQSIEDLVGKSVAVNTLNTAGHLAIRALLAESGTDPDAVEFVELAFPDMGPTLASGGVDAVWLVEPFRTTLDGDGARKLFPTYEGPTAEIPVSGLGMTAQFVEENPNTVAAFVRAIERANSDLANDPELAREITPTFSSATPELAEQFELPLWTEESISAANLQIWNDLMVEHGALDEPVDLESMVYKG